jgi:hypothetical protein
MSTPRQLEQDCCPRGRKNDKIKLFLFLFFLYPCRNHTDVTAVHTDGVGIRANGGARPHCKLTTQSIYLRIFYTRILQCLEVMDAPSTIVCVLVHILICPLDNPAMKAAI